MSVLAAAAFILFTAQFPDTFLGSMSVGNEPVDLCISPDGQRAYTAAAWGFAAVIDIEGYDQFTFAGLVSIEGEPSAIQCDATGQRLYVADSENSLVHVVDTETLTVTSSFPVESSPVDMVLCSGYDLIYLSHSGGLVTVINTQTSSVEDVFWAGSSLHSLALSPDGEWLYAPDNGSPLESRISAESGVVNRFSSGLDSRAAAVSGDGGLLFLSCTEWNLIGVVNAEDLSPETTIGCEDGAPVEMAALPTLPYLYGVNSEMNALYVYGTDDLKFKGTVSVPGEPVNMAVHPDGERIFVVCAGDNKLKVYGYDPSGLEPGGTAASLVPVSSPSPEPSVVTSGLQGEVTIRAFDLSGRKVFEHTGQAAAGQPWEVPITRAPAGLLMVTAETSGTALRTRVMVLEP